MADLEALKAEFDDLTEQLADPELISDWEKFQTLSKRRAALEKIIKKSTELEHLQSQIEENEQIIASEEEPELASLAQQELSMLKQKQHETEQELEQMLNQDKDLPEAVIIEIRPGTGGEEASLFARDLWDMYSKYAANKGWKTTVLHSNETEVGGLREVAFQIGGEEAYENLQYEGGVHRVQRIPATEKAGRIHTSTASVAILPKPKETQLELNPSDIKVEFTTSSGPGGQNVNKRQTAVRVTHVPTGLVVTSETSRSQQANREAAMALLKARIFEQQREQNEQERSQTRKLQIGSAARAEKIRTYNFPQDRITDHRIKQSWHGIEKILEGNLDEIAEALQEYEKNEPADA